MSTQDELTCRCLSAVEAFVSLGVAGSRTALSVTGACLSGSAASIGTDFVVWVAPQRAVAILIFDAILADIDTAV